MIRKERSERTIYVVATLIMVAFTVIILYPLIYVVSASFSSPLAVKTGKVLLWPVDVSLDGYKAVFGYRDIWIGYANSIFYTVIGTTLNVIVTMCCAYPLSRPKMQGKKVYLTLMMITMYFGGGIIPTYILVNMMNLVNTRTILIVSGLVSVYNVIVARTFLQTNIPGSLVEAAIIDGCSEFQVFARIIIPLSKAIIAVLVLYYAVGHWNSYFNAMIYTNDKSMYPLQLILRQVLVMNQTPQVDMVDRELIMAKQGMTDLLKYAIIVVSTVPVMLIYPFVQKHFTKGVMIGSVKG